ncbi:unnamed protein product [Cuscuta campestris]|uniref:RING-type E3 ubiquitin transferase n=1 Tax=Cuscuta campestris TaxID=132261 RepID=A0A484KQN9_9ASTE|nr:unnamed protein product [Cuscuta campestris]
MMMAPPENGMTVITAVAIDKDKNSQHAVKWAIENLPKKSRNLILVHVIVQPNTQPSDCVIKEGRPPTNEEVQSLFLPFRGSCARKGVTAKEVVLVGLDVTNALSEYICICSISTIVLGASSRSVLARAFKNVDVPTNLGKSVPDFCTVYAVSSRGRVQTVKTATRSPAPAATPYSRQSSQSSLCLSFPDTLSSSDLSNQGTWKSSGSLTESCDGGSIQSGMSERHVQPWDSGYGGKNNPLPPLSSSNYSYESTPRSPWDSRSSTSSGSSDSGQMPFNRQLGSKNMSSSQQQPNKIPSTPYLSPAVKSNTNLNQRGRTRDTSYCSTTDSELSGQTNYSSSVSFEYLEASGNSHSSSAGVSSEYVMFLCLSFKGTVLFDTLYDTLQVEEDEEIKRLKQELKNTLERLDEARRPAYTSKADAEAAEIARRIAKLSSQRNGASIEKEIQYRRYRIEEIEVATNYFAKSQKIGEGGYGPVYKAVLDHTTVAIKVLRPDIPQGQKQFQQEIEVLSRIRHPNMVLLLGACDEYGCLVYEYMENGSLDDRLFCKSNTPPIPWTTRFAIAAEIATALNFLHHAKPSPLVHRDLKPANILLDKNYVSKISDVGLARLVPPSVADCITQYQVTAAAGTFCYIDPEYQQTGKLSTKSDIYSLGVLLLQIITARSPMGLKHHVERAIEEGKFADILDPAVKDWPVREALSYAKLALKCCELKGRDRPDLGSVILPELERLRNLRYRNSPPS